MKAHIQSTALFLIGLLFAGCASKADSPHSTVARVDALKSAYLLEVTFEWGVGDNPHRTIQTEVEVGKEFYVKVLDRNGNYHAIQGTLQQEKSGEFHLPLRLANWSAMGSTYTTIPLDLRVGGSWGEAQMLADMESNYCHDHRNSVSKQTVQRTGASRFAQTQIERHRRLAPVADLALASLAMRKILVILWVFAFASLRAEDKAAAPDFSKYPQTESFRYYLSGHTNAAWQLQRTNLLIISAFPGGDRHALQYFVTESGQEGDYRNVYKWAIQALHSNQLSETNLASLRLAIRDLPAASTSPPIERLVIVSFREGTNWVTRSYDSGTLPKSMRQIYDIIGERFESRKAK